MIASARPIRLAVAFACAVASAAPAHADPPAAASRSTPTLATGAFPASAPSPSRTWLEHAVVYGVIPRNMGRRPARAVTEDLERLHRLGVDAIYLPPIFPTPRGDFGYAVTDYVHLRHDFGSEREFHALVGEAHRLGMRVLVDMVPNHTSVQHPYYRSAHTLGRRSPYYGYYDRDASGNITHYFDWSHLPNLDYANPRVQSMMLGAFTHWVRDFGIDGFRVDAAWGIRQRAPAFWPRAIQSLRAIRPDLVMIAEASARDPYYTSAGFDAAYDWTDGLGEWAWRDVFDGRPDEIPSRLHAALTDRGAPPTTAALVFRFLNNNDTGARFVTRHGPEVTRAAAALLLTLPGAPLVYFGDEVGAEYEPYAAGTRLIARDDDPHALREHYRHLIAMRHTVAALTSQDFAAIAPTPGATSYAFTRGSGNDRVLVVVNFGSDSFASLPPDSFAATTASRAGRVTEHDVWSDADVAVTRGADGRWRVPMAPFALRVLTMH
jgi:glycosidase